MKRYNITNDTKGGIKAVESNTGHWMVAAEVERMLQDLKEINTDEWEIDYTEIIEEEDDNGN